MLILKFTLTQIKCNTSKHYHEARKIQKIAQALNFLVKTLLKIKPRFQL